MLVLNLKMNFSAESIKKYETFIKNKEVIVLPQFPYLLFFRNGLYSLGSQNVSKFSKGSYTGEVCAKALKGLGVKYCLVGHSERKEYFYETINDFRMKITNLNDVGIIPIYCINQTRDEYENDSDLKNIENQLEGIPDYVKYIVIAFEPSWMIGGSEEELDIGHINNVLIRIKSYLMERNIGHSILYGGGVDSSNIEVLKKLSCLHPTCIQPAKYANIPVRLLNTMDPTAPGTLISNDTEKGKIKAVAAKDNITAIKIKSSRMLLAHGFLRKVFEIFESYQTSIDMICTSEVGVSVSIDNVKHLNEILDDLKKYGTVTVDKDMCIICVVGDLEWENVGFEAKALDAMRDIPVRMICFGGSNYNISFLIRECDKKAALQSLSDALFNEE